MANSTADDLSISKIIEFAEADVADHSYPLVFRCSTCHEIIGDSLSWVCANEDLRTITLKRVSRHVREGPKLKMSAEGFDLGSAYMPFTCGRCGTDLGRIYRTTPKHLDNMRELYTIDVDKLDSYQVGCSDQQTANVLPSNEELLTFSQAKYVLVELRKMQKTVTELSDRVTELSGRVMKLEGSSLNHKRTLSSDANTSASVEDEERDGNSNSFLAPETIAAVQERSNMLTKSRTKSSGHNVGPSFSGMLSKRRKFEGDT